MPRDDYRRENRALRDIGRAMSGGRDADVMVETSESLAERFGRNRELAALRRRLAAYARGRQDGADVDALVDSLRAAAERAASWPFGDCDLAALQAGEKRAYRDGRRAFADAREEASAERLHEWRKRVKDLWYHHRLLANAWRGPLKAHADECDTLGSLLGDGVGEVPGDGDEVGEAVARQRGDVVAGHGGRGLGWRLVGGRPAALAGLVDREADHDRDQQLVAGERKRVGKAART
jgi:hypothetical protein